ncbi:MAG: hypothetical protein CML23_00695 [Rhizobiaceae bacterium]|mgnify:CR=1 FL=1|nr:hypothetical protein [Rhizobiaceae bacterium]
MTVYHIEEFDDDWDIGFYVGVEGAVLAGAGAHAEAKTGYDKGKAGISLGGKAGVGVGAGGKVSAGVVGIDKILDAFTYIGQPGHYISTPCSH